MPEQSNDYRVAVFGSAGVGKSSLVQRFIKSSYKEQYTPTVEDTYRKVITNDKQVCTLQITDTTGSHQFPAMMRLAMSKGHGFVFVYSVTSRNSLVELNKLVTEVKEIKGADIAKCPMMVVANKCDDSAREVSKEAGNTIATKWGCGFIETSAKDDINVTEMFEQLLQMDKQRNMALMGEKKKKSKLGLGSKDKKEKSKENKPGNSKENKEKPKKDDKKEKEKDDKKSKDDKKTADKTDKKESAADSSTTEGADAKKCSVM